METVVNFSRTMLNSMSIPGEEVVEVEVEQIPWSPSCNTEGSTLMS